MTIPRLRCLLTIICFVGPTAFLAPTETHSQPQDQNTEEARRLRQEGEQAVLGGDYAKAETPLRRLLAIQEKALGFEHNDTVRTLFFLGASLEAQGKVAESKALRSRSASTGLLEALFTGDAERALALLDKGANPDARNPRGQTALMYAGLNGQTTVMKKLLEMGADVRPTMTEEGTTALMAAVMFGDPEAVRLLLAKGADATVKNTKGETALALARQRLAIAPTERRMETMILPERTQYGDLSAATKEEFEEIIGILEKHAQ